MRNPQAPRRWIVRLVLLAVVLMVIWWSRQPGTAVQALGSTYTVRPGDSLSRIAAEHDTTVAELVALNTDQYPSLATNPGLIEPGWVLALPDGAQGEDGTLWDQAVAWINARVAPLVHVENLTLSPTPAPPSGTAASTTAPAPGGIAVGDEAAEQAILEMINQERIRLGLQPLVMDEGLRVSARERCRDMLTRGYFSHHDPETGASLANGTWEVLARGCGWSRSNAVAGAHAWWNSPGHYAAITNGDLHRIGIGVAYGDCTVVTGQLLP
jgi:uncharacterized protein YkwD